LIAARDEQAVIGAKLDSVLAQRWPPSRLEVLVIDDGSSDDTAAVVEQRRTHATRGAVIRLVRMERSGGKALALNRGAAEATGEVLVLTDARQPLCEGALAALVATLGDSSVGAVSGELELPGEGGGLALYRRLDDQLRRWEAATGSTVGVTGA